MLTPDGWRLWADGCYRGVCERIRGGEKRGTKKIPATTYFLGPQTDIIGAGGLTAVFGMGTGVSLPLWSPGKNWDGQGIGARQWGC